MTKTHLDFVTTTKVVASAQCDWCGCDVPIDHLKPGRYPVLRLEFDVTIAEKGQQDGHGYGWNVSDLCETCGQKLRELLEEAGVKVTEWEL